MNDQLPLMDDGYEDFIAGMSLWLSEQEAREFYWTQPDTGRDEWYESINTRENDNADITDDPIEIFEAGRAAGSSQIYHQGRELGEGRGG